MTEKRFIIPNQLRVIRDTVTGEEAIFYDTEDGLILEKWLNELHEENKELKKENVQFDILIKNNQLAYIDLEKENGQLKQGVNHWKKILNDYQQIVIETLREQYHWLKNEDKILNQDKIVALLELESIATYLGIELE